MLICVLVYRVSGTVIPVVWQVGVCRGLHGHEAFQCVHGFHASISITDSHTLKLAILGNRSSVEDS